ncbi:MAG: hypothetical protein CUN51_01405 [Candidatus Thermofonsia Clade 1 bacterium]|uniref:Uncharacterized protein n=1 Tax=Candidatus Thermofonsia Clade 1 bacterium TaxID=2364210 RepID=A0A2M8P449_9CHLR|nr:MAG: hypothetical protein CUN51_01405 [Candidatus Thermofonsia Clade 1 bacterium]
MELVIEGVLRAFVLISTFRAEHGLLSTFGVALFEPKDFSGLGRIDQAARTGALQQLHERVLEQTPSNLPVLEWLEAIERLTYFFEAGLRAANAQIGLREAEIGFAVSGFADALSAYAYAALRATTEQHPLPRFSDIYSQWCANSVRLSQTRHVYAHGESVWQVQIVYTVYGRVGLVVQTDQARHYVADGQYTCPAEGFMRRLMEAVAAKISTTQPESASA